MKQTRFSYDEILEMHVDERFERMKEIYLKQKLSKTGNFIARGIEILVALLLILTTEFDIYTILWIGILLFAIYRFVKKDTLDKENFEELRKVSDKLELFKKYKAGEVKISLEDKKVDKLENSLKRNLPKLFKNGSKLVAYIPLLNVRIDEMTVYNDKGGALNLVLNGTLRTPGLNDLEVID